MRVPDDALGPCIRDAWNPNQNPTSEEGKDTLLLYSPKGMMRGYHPMTFKITGKKSSTLSSHDVAPENGLRMVRKNGPDVVVTCRLRLLLPLQ